MPDIYCRHCGEPWDMDELHDMDSHDYKAATERFRNLGCNAWSNTDLKCSSAITSIISCYCVLKEMCHHALAIKCSGLEQSSRGTSFSLIGSLFAHDLPCIFL